MNIHIFLSSSGMQDPQFLMESLVATRLQRIVTRSSRARHGGPVGRAQPTQRSILKRPSLLIASIFPAMSTCASAWFDHLQVDSPKVTPIFSPVLYDSQTLCECQGPSGCDKPPSSPPNSTTKSGHHRLRSYKARSAALRKCPYGAINRGITS